MTEEVPVNSLRKALASIYMEKYMGTSEEDMIKRLTNGCDKERSLGYYIGCESMINGTSFIRSRSRTT